MSEYVKEVNEGTFEEVVLQSEKPIGGLLGAMVQTMRRELAPIVESVAEQYANSAHVVS